MVFGIRSSNRIESDVCVIFSPFKTVGMGENRLASMDAMVLAVVADTVSNCRQRLLLRLRTDIVTRRDHFGAMDFAADRTDALDIVRSDIVIAVTVRTVVWRTDLASDSYRMQTNMPLAVGVHSMAVDMEVERRWAALATAAVSADTCSSGRPSCDRLCWRPPHRLWPASDLSSGSHDRRGRPMGPAVGTKTLVSRTMMQTLCTRTNYSERVP